MNESGVWIWDWKKEKKEEMAMALSKWIHAIHTEYYLTLLRDIFKIEIFYYFLLVFTIFVQCRKYLEIIVANESN